MQSNSQMKQIHDLKELVANLQAEARLSTANHNGQPFRHFCLHLNVPYDLILRFNKFEPVSVCSHFRIAVAITMLGFSVVSQDRFVAKFSVGIPNFHE